MSRYRRAQVPGATYFFTVNLRNRRSDLLVRHIDLLRETVRATRERHPFHIDACLIICIASGPSRTATLISRCAGRSLSLRLQDGFPKRRCLRQRNDPVASEGSGNGNRGQTTINCASHALIASNDRFRLSRRVTFSCLAKRK